MLILLFSFFFFFFFNDTATTEIYTLSLHDALPILIYGIYSWGAVEMTYPNSFGRSYMLSANATNPSVWSSANNLQMGCVYSFVDRSEEHTSELQSHSDLVCRLLLEKKKKKKNKNRTRNVRSNGGDATDPTWRGRGPRGKGTDVHAV